MNKERLKVAVIGLGKMGLLHASILNTLPNVELTSLCDKSALIRRFCKRVSGKFHVIDDLAKLSNLDLDIVYVTTPIPSHFHVAKGIYLKGIANNIFVEKTLASSFYEAKELCDLTRSFGGANMVGYMKRFAATFKRAKDLLDQGILGEVISFDGYAYSSDFSSIKKSSRIPKSRGGVLRDLGAHVVDLALWFFGDFGVRSVELESSTEGGPEDSVRFRVRKVGGLEGVFDISWCMQNYRLPEFGLVAEGSEGTMRVNDDKVELKLKDKESHSWYRHDLDDNVGYLLGAPEYFREDDYFIKSVLEGRDTEPSFYTASRVDYLIEQVEKGAGKTEGQD